MVAPLNFVAASGCASRLWYSFSVMTPLHIIALVIAIAVGYFATASRFTGTPLCPKWWERFILSRSSR